MRRRGPQPLTIALERLLDDLQPATLIAEVQRIWPAVVGEQVAASCAPESEKAGQLTIVCESAVWAQEIALLAEQFVGQLNERLSRPAITGLKAHTIKRRS